MRVRPKIKQMFVIQNLVTCPSQISTVDVPCKVEVTTFAVVSGTQHHLFILCHTKES